MTLTVTDILSATAAITISTLVLTFITIIQQARTENTINQSVIHKRKKHLFHICICVALLNVAVFGLNHMASRKGMEPNTPVAQAIEGFAPSPWQTPVPKDLDQLKGSLVVFYRYTCGDCHAVMDKIQNELSGYDNVYYLSSRSKEATAIRQKYADIVLVPSLMLIGTDEYPTTYVASLAISDGNGEVVVNVEEMKSLLDMYHKIHNDIEKE